MIPPPDSFAALPTLALLGHLGPIAAVIAAVLLALRPDAGERLGLTDREFEVLQHVEVGRSNREIGVELGIEEDTVAKHLYNAYRKLGVSSRTQALYRLAQLTGDSAGDAYRVRGT